MAELTDCLVNYEGWLHHTASGFGDSGLHDDLVQEGRIAMWGQLKKHGSEHVGFMTSQARLRMGQIVRGDGQFGNTEKGRSGRDVKPVASVDQFDVPIGPTQMDIAEAASWAYHHGEIHAAIDSLSPKRREAVVLFLRDGAMTHAQRVALADARAILATELSHLEDR